MPRLKIVFLGSDPIALPLLDSLAGNPAVELIAVVTQPDRPVGRGQHVVANGIKTWALARALPVLQPEKLTEEFRLQFAALGADLSLVMAYGHILKEAFIGTPRLGTLNLHASILPEFRGASPIQSAVAIGREETGVSLMRIVRKLDAGPVADVERVRIGRTDTASEVEAKLASACVPLVARNLPALAANALTFLEQEETAATYCRRLTKADGAIDFAQPAAELAHRINGLYPWPGCAVQIREQNVKLGLADWSEEEEGQGEGAIEDEGDGKPAAATERVSPGKVLGLREDALCVGTGRGVLRLLRLQRPGGKMLGAAEFLRGFEIPEGTVLPSTPMQPLVGPVPFKW
ncbi:MAG TPA: methionyl-tRNA formyltransferase [Opitutaceae bacterium]|nr:methionyl-tRNA formyltransferase [Opitutaceae bacterium]